MRRASIGAVLLVTGCVSQAQVNDSRSDELRTRAAFDLNCDAGQLAVTKLNSEAFITMAGVDGCGRRATYVYEHGKWIMNTASGEPTQTQTQTTESGANP